MKILQIGKYYKPEIGGIEKVCADIAENTSGEEYRVDVLCHHTKNENSIEQYENYTVYKLGIIKVIASTPIISIKGLLLLLKVIKNYDYIHLHLPNPLLATLVLPLLKNKKLVLHWHSDIVKQKILSVLYGPFQWILLRKATLIIATSEKYKNESPVLNAFREKTIAIPLAINPEDIHIDENYANLLKQNYPNKKIIFTIGRLVSYKGFDILIKAAEKVDSQGVILIAGKGPLKDNLESLIVKHGLQDKVKLIGYVTDAQLGALFRECYMFCLPSISKAEAFGIVQIEAMMYGKPVICTDIYGSGVPWVNLDKLSGFVVPVKNEEALAEKINILIHESTVYNLYSINARIRALDLFHMDAFNRSMKDMYKSIKR